jgi:heme/copper-type cytochrome/quinol oxidase subunit 2
VKRVYLGLVALFLLLASPTSVLGCAACFGKSDSPMAYGMNAGIMTLLVFIGTLLGLVTSFFVFIARRAARLAEAESPAPEA